MIFTSQLGLAIQRQTIEDAIKVEQAMLTAFHQAPPADVEWAKMAGRMSSILADVADYFAGLDATRDQENRAERERLATSMLAATGRHAKADA